jgi:hypothetical protein
VRSFHRVEAHTAWPNDFKIARRGMAAPSRGLIVYLLTVLTTISAEKMIYTADGRARPHMTLVARFWPMSASPREPPGSRGIGSDRQCDCGTGMGAHQVFTATPR